MVPLFLFVEVVATDRIAVLMPTLDKLTDCENCSALESEISWIQGQHQRERDALMDKLLALEKSLSEAVAANERDRKAWEKKQKQQKEETDRERKAWGHQQQQAVERQKRQMLEQMGQERQTQQQQSAVTNKALRELRSDVDVLVQFSDVYVLDMAAEVLERFLKRPKSGGASWSASSIFRDRERDVVHTALQQGGVQYDVGRFAELAAHLLNSRRSVTHFADDGADLRSAQRS